MPNIIFQPAGSAKKRHDVAYSHFKRTIETPVPLDVILSNVEPEVDGEAIKALPSASDSQPCLLVWGAMTGKGGVLKATWDKIQPGDSALFAMDSVFQYHAWVVGKVHSPRLARALWGELDGQTWEWVYFLSAGQKVQIPVGEVTAKLGRENHKVIQRLNVVALPNGLNPLEGLLLVGSPGDLQESQLLQRTDLTSTEKQALVLSRRGQGKFRSDLLELWGGKCAVTGVSLTRLVRASHSKPWAESNNFERLDPFNGLPLTPTYDLAFDLGAISFDNSGGILIAPGVDPEELKLAGIDLHGKLTKIHENHKPYLEWHRTKVFGKKFNPT